MRALASALLVLTLAACESPTYQTEPRAIGKPAAEPSPAASGDDAAEDVHAEPPEATPAEEETAGSPETARPSDAQNTPEPPAPEATVGPTSTILATYEGRLADGTVFDSGTGVRFPLPNLIEGMQSGLIGMVEGESKRLVIPPDLAYGERGIPGRVPPGATLTFEVTVVRILD